MSMQVLGAFHKRKSIQKVIPEMPKRKISQNSRQKSRRKNRTQYTGLQSPQVELKNYKRKNFKILSQLQTTGASTPSKQLTTLASERTLQTIRTLQTKMNTQQNKKRTQQNRNQMYSINSFKRQISEQRNSFEQKQQITSRFTEDHHNTQQSLAFLINHAKSKDSNPLINTARLKQQEQKRFSKIQMNSQKNNQFHQNQSQNKLNSNQKIHKQANSTANTSMKNLNSSNQIARDMTSFNQIKINLKIPQVLNNIQPIADDRIEQHSLQDKKISIQQMNKKQSSSNINQQDQENNYQNQQNEEQNFEDYEFGGKNSGSNIQFPQQTVSGLKPKKKKNNKIMPPPKVQSYTNDIIPVQKPKNWRQLNRYIPHSQQQHRMAQQHMVKQKQKLSLKRQQEQIMKLIQQYQLNKNNVNMATKRKIQANKIIQNMYKNKRIHQKHSMSLPQLKNKNISQIKKQIIIPQHCQIYGETYANSSQQKYKVKNLLAKSVQREKNKQLVGSIRHSLSFNKLGFGSRQSRNLYQDQLKQNQLENVEKIQRRLRQKGVQFNPDSIRKGLLNLRDVPAYTISKGNIRLSSQQALNNQDTKLPIPQKKLPSNAFYKIFPL